MPDLYTFAVRSAKPKHYKIHKISQIKKTKVNETIFQWSEHTQSLLSYQPTESWKLLITIWLRGMTSKTTKKNNLSKCIVDLKIAAKGAAF